MGNRVSDDSPQPGLLEELKRRNVFRVAAMYAVVGWLLIQIGEATFDALGLPEGSLRLLILAVAAGFPVALVLGWLFDWTSEGLVRTSADPEAALARVQSHRRIDFAIIGVLVLALGMALVGPELDPSPSAAPEGPGVEPTPSSLGQRPAVAVLPFDNRSPDPEQAFFADGLAEDLITRLSTWRAFPVIARSSSFRYRGGGLDLEEVGRQLGSRYLVTGSVRRSGERIRVTAQLVDAVSGENIWAESYDRGITDLFALQDEVSATIAASLVGDLTRAEGERARLQGTDDLEAWSLYQLGLQHSDRFTRDDSIEAAQFFERSVARDPRFATGHARLALEHWMMFSGHGDTATEEQITAALSTARRAVELDPRDPIAHAALGAVYLTAGDPANAIDAARRAVELNPSMPEGWIWFGWASLLAGDPEACIVATERAQRLDPQRPNVWVHDSLALARWEVGDYEAALAEGRRLVALQPGYFTGYLYIAMSAVSLGRLDEARAAIAEGRRMRPDLSIALMQNYLAVSRPEADARRDAVLRRAGLE